MGTVNSGLSQPAPDLLDRLLSASRSVRSTSNALAMSSRQIVALGRLLPDALEALANEALDANHVALHARGVRAQRAHHGAHHHAREQDGDAEPHEQLAVQAGATKRRNLIPSPWPSRNRRRARS